MTGVFHARIDFIGERADAVAAAGSRRPESVGSTDLRLALGLPAPHTPPPLAQDGSWECEKAQLRAQPLRALRAAGAGAPGGSEEGIQLGACVAAAARSAHFDERDSSDLPGLVALMR